MSISLNDHENRIKALENNSGSGSVVVNNYGVIGRSTFDMSTFQSEYLWFVQCDIRQNSNYYSTRYYNTAFVFKKGNNIAKYRVGGGGNWAEDVDCKVSDNIASVVTRAGSVIFGQLTAVGLKLYYNFSYNIYCLICIFLEFLFKEV